MSTGTRRSSDRRGVLHPPPWYTGAMESTTTVKYESETMLFGHILPGEMMDHLQELDDGNTWEVMWDYSLDRWIAYCDVVTGDSFLVWDGGWMDEDSFRDRHNCQKFPVSLY